MAQRKPIERLPAQYAGGKMPALDFWYPPFDVYACVKCGAKIHYHPTFAKFPPPQLCWECEGTKFSHTFEDDVQPETTSETVTRHCAVCGCDISDRRSQTKTCSAKCRKALSRQ